MYQLILDNLQLISFITLLIFMVIYVFLSNFSMNWISRKLALTTKMITDEFKKQKMDKVDVEGVINLGLMKFSVTVTDRNNKLNKKNK